MVLTLGIVFQMLVQNRNKKNMTFCEVFQLYIIFNTESFFEVYKLHLRTSKLGKFDNHSKAEQQIEGYWIFFIEGYFWSFFEGYILKGLHSHLILMFIHHRKTI